MWDHWILDGIKETWAGWLSVGVAVSLLWRWRAACARKREHAKLEAVRRESQRRTTGPYYFVHSRHIPALYYKLEGSALWHLSMENPNLLAPGRDLIGDDVPVGAPIYLPIENHGEPTMGEKMQSEMEGFAHLREVEVKYAKGIEFLTYSYKPEKRGTEETITLAVRAPGGIVDTHTYAMTHGHRALRRIDP